MVFLTRLTIDDIFWNRNIFFADISIKNYIAIFDIIVSSLMLTSEHKSDALNHSAMAPHPHDAPPQAGQGE